MNPPQNNAPQGDTATEVWLLMSKMVLARDRRTLVSDALGISFSRARAVRRAAKRPMPMSQLAATLGIDPSNATVLVNSLEDEGLLERRADPSDRRTRLVGATRKGKALAKKAEAILNTPPTALSEADERDLETLARILNDVARQQASQNEGR